MEEGGGGRRRRKRKKGRKGGRGQKKKLVLSFTILSSQTTWLWRPAFLQHCFVFCRVTLTLLTVYLRTETSSLGLPVSFPMYTGKRASKGSFVTSTKKWLYYQSWVLASPSDHGVSLEITVPHSTQCSLLSSVQTCCFQPRCCPSLLTSLENS